MNLDAQQVAALVLGSSLLSALLSAVASALLASWQYKRDYHKEVVVRRLSAYEDVYAIIGILRGSVYDTEGRVAHLIFAHGQEGIMEVQAAVARAITHSLWLDPAVRDQLVLLNRLLLTVDETDETQIRLHGAQLYSKLVHERERLEDLTARSLERLHNVRAFLHAKRAQTKVAADLRSEQLPRSGAYEA